MVLMVSRPQNMNVGMFIYNSMVKKLLFMQLQIDHLFNVVDNSDHATLNLD